ncbi:MAG: MFS transporter [Desulfobacterales bacterium GWB2_56_26]|nr:MAG: MFS transporter [Desulfobacterales bacterium GWB2_56_26]
MAAASPFAITNIRLFIAFRVFFNARFYYPVFTILFLDFGLTIEQFALLNSVWAVTIFSAEVPSGALADLIGRKRLIVATSFCMIAEMSLLAFVPLGSSSLVFSVFLVNRILSGLAEAMASGADEAIAYDSLAAEGNSGDWPKVLSLQMRLHSVASIITLTLGALVYDPSAMNRMLAWLGSSHILTQQTTMRFPIYLTLGMAVLATVIALRMEEQTSSQGTPDGITPLAALRKVWQAGRWIIRTPFALAVILFGMGYDHVLRMVVTMTSQYFREIELPEASFGLIGSAMALLGLVTPKIAERMAVSNSPPANLAWVSAVSLAGLFGLCGFYPYWGLLPMALIFVAMMFVAMFTSHYLNLIAESHQRATVLSFKGMAFNLAYGLIGVFFALLTTHLRGNGSLLHPEWSATVLTSYAFREALTWFPWYTVAGLGLAAVACSWYLRKTRTPGHPTSPKEGENP